MKITKENAYIINSREFSLHDDMPETLSYDFTTEPNKRMLIMKIKKFPYGTEKYTLTFGEVLAFETTACDFWGPSDRISCFAYLEGDECTLIPKLKAEEEKWCKDCSKIDFDNYIETFFEFVSGDTMRIVSKSICRHQQMTR